MLVKCPHCSIPIEILELNCGIFRCAIMKDTGIQIPPHSPKDFCLELAKKDLIYGCGKPFKIVNGLVEMCGWEE